MTYTGALTDDQIEEVVALRDEWMRIGLSTDRCDRPAAEAAVHAAYAAAGLARPSLTIWMDSPLGGLYALAMLVHEVFPLLTRDQLRSQLRDQLDGQLRDQLYGQLDGQLWGRLRSQLRFMYDSVWRHMDAWRDAYWLALYDRAFAYAPLPRSAQLDTMAQAIRHTGWWWPTRGAVVLTDRPTVLQRDQQGRLHGETGPALAYADGYGGHWWHGVRVPADLVAGDGWDPERILRERNAEVRRCAIERRGWGRFVHDAGLAQVGPAESDPGNPGQQLRLYNLPPALANLYGAPARILIASNASLDRDGSRRTFGLPVPAEIGDPVTAAATTFGVGREEYAGLARAT